MTQRTNFDDATTRSVGIHEFVLLDVGEKYGPPVQPVLRVSLLPDRQVSFAIEQYDEDAKKATFTRIESIIVDLEPLMNGLLASGYSEGTKKR